jgi:hypothetical protein
MAQSLAALVKQGEGNQDAVDLGDGIFMSKNIANSYLITTAEGDVLINTGTDCPNAAGHVRRRLDTPALRVGTFEPIEGVIMIDAAPGLLWVARSEPVASDPQPPERGTPAETPERLTPAETPERIAPTEPPERLVPAEPPERLTPA